MPRLVFGDDGSPSADVAWLWINEQRWPGWHLEMVTAVGAPDEAHHPTAAPPPSRRPFAEAGFVASARRLPEQDPRLALCTDGELLVIGERGPGVLKSLHLGSTAEWLAVRPPMPMVIARHGRPTRSVVLATDGSVDAGEATEALAGLPFAEHLTVTVAVVDDGRVTDVDAVLDAAATRLRAAGATAIPLVLRGSPTDELVGLAASSDADLVAFGTRGRSRLEHVRIGSTARRIVHGGRFSVLVAHRRLDSATPPLDGTTT